MSASSSLWSPRLVNESTFDVIALASCLGAAFSGYQEQPNLAGNFHFVQTELEQSLALVVGVPRVTLLAASRTDAGVHARALLIRASLPATVLARLVDKGGPDGLRDSWNTALRADIRIARLRWAAPSQIFLRDASRGKVYSYYVRGGPYVATLDAAPYSMHIANATTPHFAARVAAALAQLQGTHDFSPFAMGRGHESGGIAATRTISHAVVSLIRINELNTNPMAEPPPPEAGTHFYASDAMPVQQPSPLLLPSTTTSMKRLKRQRDESINTSATTVAVASATTAVTIDSLPPPSLSTELVVPPPPLLCLCRVSCVFVLLPMVFFVIKSV